MSFPIWRSIAAVPLAVCLGAVAGAADPPDRPDAKPAPGGHRAPGTARPIGPTSAVATTFGARVTAILGTAWTADNQPIRQASLRLRNVVSGKVQATAVANDAGQFAFENVEGGSYVVELLNDGGRVEVVGHVFTIAAGETVATFVRTGTKVPWFTGFFNNTVSSVASTAASQGVTAIAPLARPISPKQYRCWTRRRWPRARAIWRTLRSSPPWLRAPARSISSIASTPSSSTAASPRPRS